VLTKSLVSITCAILEFFFWNITLKVKVTNNISNFKSLILNIKYNKKIKKEYDIIYLVCLDIYAI
jgi:hypothetical protein